MILALAPIERSEKIKSYIYIRGSVTGYNTPIDLHFDPKCVIEVHRDSSGSATNFSLGRSVHLTSGQTFISIPDQIMTYDEVLAFINELKK
jgi:hypothetical protein